MKKIEYFDPSEVSEIQGASVRELAFPTRLDATATDLARKVWAFSKRKITDRLGRVIIGAADTMTSAFARKIEEFLSDEEHLAKNFDGKRPTDQMMADRAGFSRPKWNRLTSATHLDIERGNAFAVAIALKLDEAQTAELLYAGGFVLNYEHELDCAMMYFIKQGIYDLRLITSTLSQFCDLKNGFDKFTFTPKSK